MVKASDLKKGMFIKINGEPHSIEHIQTQSPSARGGATLYKVRYRSARTKQQVNETYRGDDALEEADFERREIQFLYDDPECVTFMDSTDFNQFAISREDLAEELPFLSEELEGILALCSDGRVLGIQLPPVVELPIVETGPSMKGASATSRTKPATLQGGHVIQVPEYVESGTIVKVDTRSGDFISRA